MNVNVIEVGGFSALLLEGVKFLLRKYYYGTGFDFSSNFYLVAIPTLNILVVPLLYFLGLEGFSLPSDWLGFGQLAVQALVGSLISVFIYEKGVKPVKDYRRSSG